MEMAYTIELKKDSHKKVNKRVQKICKYLKGKPLPYWIDFPLKQVLFKDAITVKQLEKDYGIFFCNLHKGNVIGMQLVYSSYEGLISLIPMLPDGENGESYFNIVDLDPNQCGNDIYSDKIYELYKKLKGGLKMKTV